MTVRLLLLAHPPSGTDPTDPANRRLVAAIDRVLRGLPQEVTVVVLSAGPEPLVEDVSAVSPGGHDAPGSPPLAVMGDAALVASIVGRGQIPRVQAASLRGPAGALAATVLDSRPRARFVGVTVPSGADAAAAHGATAALRGAFDPQRDTVLLAAGEVAGVTEEVAGDIVAALRSHDLSALRALTELSPPGTDALAPAHTLAHALAPVRLALGILPTDTPALELHAVEFDGHTLRVVGHAG